MGSAAGFFILILILAHIPGVGFQDVSGRERTEGQTWQLSPSFWVPYYASGELRVSSEGTDNKQLPPQENGLLYFFSAVLWLISAMILGLLLVEGIYRWVPEDLRREISQSDGAREE